MKVIRQNAISSEYIALRDHYSMRLVGGADNYKGGGPNLVAPIITKI